MAEMRCSASGISVTRPCSCSRRTPVAVSFLDRCSTAFKSSGSFWRDDAVEQRTTHSRFLQLLERLTGIYALMLPNIPYQENLVLRTDTSQKVPHLLRRSQRRFIDHVEMLLRRIINDPSSCKESLQ